MNLENAIDRLPRKVLEWAMRKIEIPVVVRSVISGDMREQRQESELIVSCHRGLRFKVVIHQGSVLSHFIFTVVVDVVRELAREHVLSDLPYADDFVPMSEIIEVY